MADPDKRKQSLYFPEAMLREIKDEADRQGLSLSAMIRKAWEIAKDDMAKFPSVNDF